MTNVLAVTIICVFLGLLALDHFVFGLDAGMFLLRRGFDLIEYLAFWR